MAAFGDRIVNGNENSPSPDCDEFTFSTGVLDVSSIGGYPVRAVEVVTAGSGTLKVLTRNSGATYRTCSGLAAKDRVPQDGYLEITAIGGTTAGTDVVKVRVFK